MTQTANSPSPSRASSSSRRQSSIDTSDYSPPDSTNSYLGLRLQKQEGSDGSVWVIYDTQRDAYICDGLDEDSNYHSWFMIIDHTSRKVTLWEALTGRVNENIEKTHFLSVDAVYNDLGYYANMQPSNRVDSCDYTLSNSVQWKAFYGDQSKLFEARIPLSEIYLRPPVEKIPENISELKRELRVLVKYSVDNPKQICILGLQTCYFITILCSDARTYRVSTKNNANRACTYNINFGVICLDGNT